MGSLGERLWAALDVGAASVKCGDDEVEDGGDGGELQEEVVVGGSIEPGACACVFDVGVDERGEEVPK